MEAADCLSSVKQRALELGFNAVGVTDLEPNAHGEHLKHWLACGMAGTMTYMHRQAQRRLEPSLIVPGTHRAIVVVRNHFVADPPRTEGTGFIAKYARGPDYHQTLREPLEKLAEYVRNLGGNETITRVYIDAGPVPERELAQRAGLGWIGKNSMLINPKFGSHLFLATILTNLELPIDSPFEVDRCGTCRRCIDTCPTQAIQPERMVDSRLCISYLTIEHRGEVEDQLQPKMRDWVFGCDECQNVCPWNDKFAKREDGSVLALDESRAEERLSTLLEMDEELFQVRFGHTPLERAGVNGLRRNARIALANSRDITYR